MIHILKMHIEYLFSSAVGTDMRHITHLSMIEIRDTRTSDIWLWCHQSITIAIELKLKTHRVHGDEHIIQLMAFVDYNRQSVEIDFEQLVWEATENKCFLKNILFFRKQKRSEFFWPNILSDLDRLPDLFVRNSHSAKYLYSYFKFCAFSRTRPYWLRELVREMSSPYLTLRKLKTIRKGVSQKVPGNPDFSRLLEKVPSFKNIKCSWTLRLFEKFKYFLKMFINSIFKTFRFRPCAAGTAEVGHVLRTQYCH